MKQTSVNDAEQKYLYFFLLGTVLYFAIIAFCKSTPLTIGKGLLNIIVSRDALVTDYFELTNYGSAFFNSVIIMIMIIFLIRRLELKITGLTLAVFFINFGFSLFGKNIINGLPILLGTLLYSLLQKVSVKRYIYTGLFGTCLAPIVTETVYLFPFSKTINILCAILIGLMIGFILPALSMHTASMHMGYNLFNVGFSAGILSFVIVSIYKAFGFQIETVFYWKEGRPLWLIIVMYVYFIATFFYGMWMDKWKWKEIFRITRHPGRAVADFILMDGAGKTLVNMGMVGIFCMTYILVIKGDFSGPVLGAILTVFGFSAFGVHIKNFFPCILGVFLSSLVKVFTLTTPAIQLAAIFSACLAPIAGQFGIIAGIVARILHTSVVTATNDMYVGLNLYNNGFSAGFVAIVMIPFLESFINKFRRK